MSEQYTLKLLTLTHRSRTYPLEWVRLKRLLHRLSEPHDCVYHYFLIESRRCVHKQSFIFATLVSVTRPFLISKIQNLKLYCWNKLRYVSPFRVRVGTITCGELMSNPVGYIYMDNNSFHNWRHFASSISAVGTLSDRRRRRIPVLEEKHMSFRCMCRLAACIHSKVIWMCTDNTKCKVQYSMVNTL